MNVCKVKRNSVVTTRKLRLNDLSNKPEKHIIKNNLIRIKLPQSNKPNTKYNNNLYINSEFNIQRINNDQPGQLTYIKSLPSHIVKKQFYITTPIKLENSKDGNNPLEPKTEKNEDSLSTFPLTKENMIITPQKNENSNDNIEEKKK